VEAAQPTTRVVALIPEADAYVRAGDSTDINFGQETRLLTKGISESNVYREAFLRWDLSGQTGKLISAKLRLTTTRAAQAGNESAIALVTDDRWDESSLTYGNRPSAGTLFAQWLPVSDEVVEIDVTAPAAACLLDNAKLSFRIRSTGDYGPSGNVTYSSREDPIEARRPQLILSFANPQADWRQHFFDTPENIGDAADGSDPDSDGISNLEEFTIGSDPTEPDSWPHLSIIKTPDYAELSFPGRMASGSGYLGLSRFYTVERSAELAAPTQWLQIPELSDLQGTDQIISEWLPMADTQQFFRLYIWLQ
jgi:hypothetical protein